MINRVFPDSELLSSTLSTAALIAALPTTAIRTIKQVIHSGLQTDLQSGLVIEALGDQRLTS